MCYNVRRESSSLTGMREVYRWTSLRNLVRAVLLRPTRILKPNQDEQGLSLNVAENLKRPRSCYIEKSLSQVQVQAQS